MLIDEVLSAGDAEFTSKAHARLVSMLAGTSIVVVASHSMSGLQQFCNKGLVLHHGRISFMGSVATAVGHYEQIVASGL